MFSLIPVIAGIAILTTFGSYVQKEALDVVAKTNLRTIATVLEIYKITDGKYPESLESVAASGDLKNMNTSDWKYLANKDNSGFVLCWKSQSEVAAESENNCLPK